jgi:hypothetical protein
MFTGYVPQTKRSNNNEQFLKSNYGSGFPGSNIKTSQRRTLNFSNAQMPKEKKSLGAFKTKRNQNYQMYSN